MLLDFFRICSYLAPSALLPLMNISHTFLQFCLCYESIDSSAAFSEMCLVYVQLTLHAKKAAEDASKHALEASKQAAGVSKNTIDDLTYVGKSTFGDLTKTAKEAAAKKGLMKQQPSSNVDYHQHHHHQAHGGGSETGSMRQMTGSSQHSTGSGPGTHMERHGPGAAGNNNGNSLLVGTGNLLSSFSNEITGITSSTSSMFSGLFGKSE